MCRICAMKLQNSVNILSMARCTGNKCVYLRIIEALSQLPHFLCNAESDSGLYQPACPHIPQSVETKIFNTRYLCLDARRFSLEPEAKKVTGRYGE